MELNNRIVKFTYNMRAAKMFADFCPDRDISRIAEALSGKYGNIIENQSHFIIALNLGYCKSRDHKDEDLEPITMDELLDLEQDEFQKVFLEAAKCMQDDKQTKMQTKPAPRKKVNPQQEKQS